MVKFFRQEFGQQITYSEAEANDLRSLNFEIIGKIDQHFLIYKNIRNDNYISVLDAKMNQVNKTYLSFMPDKTLNVDFVVYPDFAWLIYQYQRKNIVHCMAVKINGDGKLMTDPFELDTTSISFFANNKIYSTIKSEDKSKILVYKIQKRMTDIILLPFFSMIASSFRKKNKYLPPLMIVKLFLVIFL